MAIRTPRLFQAAALWLPCLLIFVFFITLTCASQPRKPRLTVLGGRNKDRNGVHRPSLIASDSNNDYQTFYYDQTLDHFNYQPISYTTFQQRYVVNFKHWRGARVGAPIFAYMGEEASIDDDVGHIGFMPENSRKFGALELYIEHRYYGKSMPHGFTGDESLENATIRGYFNSAQAIADYAEVIIDLKKNLSADSSPVIVVGGSYGGTLAAWFRLKYPHIAMGALASSSPLLYFDGLVPPNSYDVVVTKDFQEVSWSCYDTIKRSWPEIDRVAAKPNGLSELSKKFKTCKPMKAASELKDYLEYIYSVVAQYDTPPDYPVTIVCKGIDEGAKGTDILGRIFSGVVAYHGESRKCYDLNVFSSTDKPTSWDWQTCSDLVTPIGRGNETIFPASPFVYQDYKDYCMKSFGVEPKPHWATTYFGGQHIKRVLHESGSNIIFSNGLRDPYSSGGVLEDISDNILAVSTKKGSHCLDILGTRADDPEWLTAQRKKEVKIIRRWLRKYYNDLHRFA
ncbi:hypothetical protein ACJW31_11G105500 [Castanea mollissima]